MLNATRTQFYRAGTRGRLCVNVEHEQEWIVDGPLTTYHTFEFVKKVVEVLCVEWIPQHNCVWCGLHNTVEDYACLFVLQL